MGRSGCVQDRRTHPGTRECCGDIQCLFFIASKERTRRPTSGNNPAESAEVLSAGWLKTGDICHVDELGRVTITDRKKDMILVSDRRSTRLNSSHAP